MVSDRIDHYMENYPKEFLSLLLIVISFVIHIPATLLGLIVYFILVKKFKLSALPLVIFSILLLGELSYFSFTHFNKIHFLQLIKETFECNFALISHLVTGKYQAAMSLIESKLLTSSLYMPFFIATGLSLINLIPDKAHAKELKALREGKMLNIRDELSEKALNKALKQCPDDSREGTVLGVSMYSGNPVLVPDEHVNQVVLVLGTTGSGKTVTLGRFYKHAVIQGHPLIIVDGKPDLDHIEKLKQIAEKHRRNFYGFNCGNYFNYDPLEKGGYTELKDKIISLKDEWSSDHYRSIAEDYLQTSVKVLLSLADPITLRKIVDCLNYNKLKEFARDAENNELRTRVDELEDYNRDDITGLKAHLNILLNSELGQYFEPNSNCFSLTQAIEENAVVYFALPALRFPSFSKVLGKLVINDIKAVVDRLDNSKKIFTVFDEFSVFAGEQVLNLVNMGRGKGLHAIFGTQGLADLSTISPSFERQLLNCANTILCHRLNDSESAEAIANWAGTRDAFTLTAQVGGDGLTEMGSIRQNKEFILHPDEIKQSLSLGEGWIISKIINLSPEKIKIILNTY